MVWPGVKRRAAAPGCTLCAGFAGAAGGFGYCHQGATGRAVDEAVAVLVHGGAFATTVGLSGSIVRDATFTLAADGQPIPAQRPRWRYMPAQQLRLRILLGVFLDPLTLRWMQLPVTLRARPVERDEDAGGVSHSGLDDAQLTRRYWIPVTPAASNARFNSPEMISEAYSQGRKMVKPFARSESI